MAEPKAEARGWGDLEDDDNFSDLDEYDVPETRITGPDENGIKTVKEFIFDEDWNPPRKIVKTTRFRVKTETVAKTNSEGVKRRSNLKFFGQSVGERGNDGITMAAREDILFERVSGLDVSNEDKKAGDLQAALMSNDKSKVVGNLRDMLYKKRMERQLLAAKGLIDGPEAPPGEDDPTMPKKGSYVPPSLRGGSGGEPAGESMYNQRRDDNSLRVTNLSEDTREQDLQELFRPFGPVTRVYIAYDRDTGLSRGFGFVNFMHCEDATRAMERLDGHGYDNLILRVEKAAPRPERPQG